MKKYITFIDKSLNGYQTAFRQDVEENKGVFEVLSDDGGGNVSIKSHHRTNAHPMKYGKNLQYWNIMMDKDRYRYSTTEEISEYLRRNLDIEYQLPEDLFEL